MFVHVAKISKAISNEKYQRKSNKDDADKERRKKSTQLMRTKFVKTKKKKRKSLKAFNS